MHYSKVRSGHLRLLARRLERSCIPSEMADMGVVLSVAASTVELLAGPSVGVSFITFPPNTSGFTEAWKRAVPFSIVFGRESPGTLRSMRVGLFPDRVSAPKCMD